MAGLLDQLLNQIMPGPSKNPYGGLLSDDMYQQYRQQQLRQGVGRMGDFLMRASGGDFSGGRGGGGQGGLLNLMKMRKYQQDQQDRQASQQKDARWAERFGGHDPTSGITWNQGRPGAAPPGMPPQQVQALGTLGREKGEGLLGAQAFQKPDTLSPEAEAQKIRMTQAGRTSNSTPAMKNAEALGLTPGTKEYSQYVRDVTLKPLVNIGGQETERQKKYGGSIGTYYGELFTGLQNTAREGRKQSANLDRLDQLLDQTETGFGQEFILKARKAGQTLGFDTAGLGTGVAPGEAAMALSNEMALQLLIETEHTNFLPDIA